MKSTLPTGRVSASVSVLICEIGGKIYDDESRLDGGLRDGFGDAV
jgi:hypothetical protein